MASIFSAVAGSLSLLGQIAGKGWGGAKEAANPSAVRNITVLYILLCMPFLIYIFKRKKERKEKHFGEKEKDNNMYSECGGRKIRYRFFSQPLDTENTTTTTLSFSCYYLIRNNSLLSDTPSQPPSQQITCSLTTSFGFSLFDISTIRQSLLHALCRGL